ncbi:MAG: putative multicopper oxidase [Pseudonocardia sp.]|jgi:hypothetical protein|nr:putative multicopper oxidase [Pseudonocardia sp.]
MDHCHNLFHAADGLVAHLTYEGVTGPFVFGGTTNNQPE